MIARLRSACWALVFAIALSPAAHAASYVFVGSWFVDQGPSWSAVDQNGNFTTPVYSGLEAAAFLFGGSPTDYAISTVSSQVSDINFKAWMDGWADSFTYGTSGTPAPQNLHIDINNDGLYATPFALGAAYSALVMDHSLHLQNFAFRAFDVAQTPLPAALPLFGTGLGLMSLVGWWRKKSPKSA